jgi:hypothetical protein
MYIVDVDSLDREKEATRHFLSNPMFRSDLLGSMELGNGCWVMMEAQKPHLVAGLVGDVDILAGNLELKNRGRPSDGIVWPPVSTRIVGVEVKCGYFSQDDGPQSEKDSPKKIKKLRGRIDLLLEMGFDKVGLLDIIANEPTEGVGAFISAAGRAIESLRAFRPLIEARLPEVTPAAQFCWPIGSVFGGDEAKRGGGGLKILRPGVENPLIESRDAAALRNRASVIESVASMLAALPLPTYWPVLFIDCADCQRVHLLSDDACLWNPAAKPAAVE